MGIDDFKVTKIQKRKPVVRNGRIEFDEEIITFGEQEEPTST
jgi:hypothetical protein